MKTFFVVLIVCATITYINCADEKYQTKFGNVDLDEILKNDRLVNAYFKCLDEGTGCTPEGEELRKILPDAVSTGCEKCTDEQKAGAKKVAKYLMKEKPDMWAKLIEKYDPDNTYRQTYQEQLKSEGLDV